MPTISVIVPVYNTEKYLRRCVDSILAQTFTDFELLLIDDGSTDSSPAICDEYAKLDSRVRVFHKANGGVSSARNIGLDNAKGDWITFADSDDWVYPTWLYIFMVENSNDFDLICQDLVMDKISDNTYPRNLNKSIHSVFVGDNIHAIEFLYKIEKIGFVFVKVFRNDIISQHRIRFNQTFHFQEDELFVLQYLSFVQRTIICLPKVGYYYYLPEWHKKYSISNNYVYKLELEKFKALNKIFESCEASQIKRLIHFLRPQQKKHLLLRKRHLGFLSTLYLRFKIIFHL